MKFPMLVAAKDSFLRALIRFWDNRFLPKNDFTSLYRDEISYLRRRNDELVSFILSSIKPITAEDSEIESTDELQSIGRPIETTIARRKRLESESLANWNRLVQEARNSQSSTSKTTEELENDLLKKES